MQLDPSMSAKTLIAVYDAMNFDCESTDETCITFRHRENGFMTFHAVDEGIIWLSHVVEDIQTAEGLHDSSDGLYAMEFQRLYSELQT